MFDFGDKRIPTVKFDATKVTPSVEAELKAVIRETPDIPDAERARIFDAALEGVKRGGDLRVIADALEPLLLSRSRVSQICMDLNRRSRSMMDRDRQTHLGVQASWLYSGAPCIVDPRAPTAEDITRDTAHKGANGQKYDPAKGMLMNGKWVRPGQEPGCRCISKSVVPGFD